MLGKKLGTFCAVAIAFTYAIGNQASAKCSDYQEYHPAPPDTGIYWFKTDEDKVKATSNPGIDYFDPSKPTLIFVHGKQNEEKVANGFYERFDYQNHDCENGFTKYENDVPVDLVEVWRNKSSADYPKGWNVGAFYWREYAALSYKEAERAIWNSDGIGGNKAVSDMLVDEYKYIMRNGYGHQEIRLAGHSFGSQVVLSAGAKIMTATDLASNEKPDRIALIDPALSNRTVLNGKEAAVLGNEKADVILGHNVALEYYRVSEANFGIQLQTNVFDNTAIHQLRQKSAFAELEPWFVNGISPFNAGAKHVAAPYLYMESMRNELHQEVTIGGWVCKWIFCTWDATLRKDTGRHALTAATPTAEVKIHTGANYYWEQVEGRRTDLTHDDKFERKRRW